MADIAFDDQVDITDKVCPLTFVKAKVAIEELDDGEVLAIRMNDGEPVQNVPRSMKEEGHKILKLEDNEDVTVLGIEKGNSYFDANVEKGKGKVVASSALAQKYELSIGDEFTLKDEETDTLYAFEVTDICQYAPAFFVFMDIDSARDLFGEQVSVSPESLY